MEDDEELSQCRALYYMGYYSLCLSRCEALRVSGQLAQQEKEALYCACKLQQQRQQQQLPPEQLSSLYNSPNPCVRAVALYALFEQNSGKPAEQALHYKKLQELFQKHCNCFSAFFTACAAATLHRYSEALEITNQVTVLELQVLRVQVLLLMNRIELAAETAEKIVAQNDDSCLGKFASALVNLFQGNSQEAYFSLEDIEGLCLQPTQHSVSPILLIGKAVANMQRRNWPESLEDALKAYEQNSCGEDVLVNLICCCRNLRKNKDADFYVERLSGLAPTHPLVLKMNELKSICSNFSTAASHPSNSLPTAAAAAQVLL